MLTKDEQELLKYARAEVNNQYNGDTLLAKLQDVNDNKEFMLGFVYKCAHALKYASKRLQDDDEIVALALEHGFYGIKYVSDRIKGKIDIMKEVVTDKRQLGLLRYASNELKDNREIALVAVTHDATNFPHLSKRLLGDEEIVMIAMKQSAYMIELASEDIKNNKVFVLLACTQSADNIKKVPTKFKDDYDVALATVTNAGALLTELSDRLKNDKTIVLAACESYSNAIKHASMEIEKLVGDNEPVHFLKSWLLKEKFEAIIPEKSNTVASKFKI